MIEWKERCVGLPVQELTIREPDVNKLVKEGKNDPFISTLGVKMPLNTVNVPK
jgi:hypothetical protein